MSASSSTSRTSGGSAALANDAPHENPDRVPAPAAWKTAIVVIAVVVVGGAAFALKAILAPFVLAVFLLLLIDGVARALRERVPHFPERLAMPAAMTLIVAFFLLVLWMVADNATQIIGQAGSYETRLNGILSELVTRFHLRIPATIGGVLQTLNPARFAGAVARSAQDVASGAFVVLIYLAFLVASRSGFVKKGAKLFRSQESRAEAERIFERIREGVEGYVWVQTITGLMIAVAAGIVMFAAGLSHAVFWAFLIFVANYVPVIVCTQT